MSGGGRADPLDELVDLVRAGDPDAIAATYLEVAPGLRGFLRRRVHHGQVADDLVEQTFVELIEGCGRVRGDARALRAWLYRAAINNLNDWLKLAERRSDHELPSADGEPMADPAADPEQQMLGGALDPDLEQALASLTPVQRDVVELRVVAGLPVAEVASITGRSEGAVKLLQHRALRRLAGLLDARPERSVEPGRNFGGV